MQTTGNTILITGGTSGIGLAFAEEFHRRGNTVIICGRRQERLDELMKKHTGMVGMVCDINNEQQREKLCADVLKSHPALNVLMNNAGVQLTNDFTKPASSARMRSEMETNFIAPLHLASLFAPHLAGRDGATIINISSGLAFVPIAFMPVYCASKAAIHSATLSLRHQLKGMGIQVVEVAPPSVDTELGHERRPDKTQTHGGIPVDEFLAEAMEALESGIAEAAIGQSKRLRAKGGELFEVMNGR